MSVLSRFLAWNTAGGARGAAKTVAEAESALARLGDERRGTTAKIRALLDQRQALLLLDYFDAAIATVDAEVDALRLTIERLDAAEPVLMSELQGLRTDAKRALWAALQAKWNAAEVDYLAAFRAAVEAHEHLSVVRAEGIAAGFASEVAAVMPFAPHILDRGLLNQYEQERDRRIDAAQPRPAPQPRPAAPPPAPKPAAATASAKPAKAAPLKPAPAPALAKIEPPKPDENGELRVKFILDGFEFPAAKAPIARASVKSCHSKRIMPSPP